MIKASDVFADQRQSRLGLGLLISTEHTFLVGAVIQQPLDLSGSVVRLGLGLEPGVLSAELSSSPGDWTQLLFSTLPDISQHKSCQMLRVSQWTSALWQPPFKFGLAEG